MNNWTYWDVMSAMQSLFNDFYRLNEYDAACRLFQTDWADLQREQPDLSIEELASAALDGLSVPR